VRDVRIAQIYEGTNGIQALDLLGRKVIADGGQALALFAGEIRAFAEAATADLHAFTAPLLDALELLESVTRQVRERAASQPQEVGAASVEYLHLFGYTAYAYLWARMAQASLGKDDEFHRGKLATARFYVARLLPRVESLASAIRAGSESLFELRAEQF